jgi:hypothetical protein
MISGSAMTVSISVRIGLRTSDRAAGLQRTPSAAAAWSRSMSAFSLSAVLVIWQCGLRFGLEIRAAGSFD